MLYRSKLVELVTPGTSAIGDTYNFRNDSDLQDCYIVGLAAWTNRSLQTGPSGNATIPSAAGLTITITEKAQKGRIREQPLTDFEPANQAGLYRFFFPFLLNWQDSYIQVNDPTTYTPGESVLVQVFYIPTSEIETYNDLFAEYGN